MRTHNQTKEFWEGRLSSQKEKLSIQESLACLLLTSGQENVTHANI